MTRKLPLLPTLFVAAAVAAMLALGVLQLRRAEWKEGLLARYERAQVMNSEVSWPDDPAWLESVFFRRAHLTCFNPRPDQPVAGRSINGETGWAHEFLCDLEPGGGAGVTRASVVMGWSKEPAPAIFRGGRLRGVISPSGRLIVDPDLAQASGLEPSAHPDPNDIPNNHLMYAGQWFFFALTALVIYVLALRKRWREQANALK